MEKFVYDNDKTRMENYRIWKELNDIERELFNDKILSPMESARKFAKLYPKEKKVISNDEWRKGTLWERR
jgi:hypothetical protein|tara:strand:+ start:2267 stop:2476 length:210 start_codon:yes stop_codon:yes gene_type:complete